MKFDGKSKLEVCPRCGFYLTDDNYCVKCGYQKNITINSTEKYNKKESDLELYLKDSYLRTIHGENNKKIFLLGPIYLSYRNHLLLGILFSAFEFFSMFYIGHIALRWGFSYFTTIIAITYLIFLRMSYMFYFDLITLFLAKQQIKRIKKRNNNYKEILSQKHSISIWKSILCIISYGIIIYLFSLVY